MNVLTTKDLMDLSIFRCRLCTRRLRYPIMQVGEFGNVCGLCFDKTPYTDAVQNEHLCLQMRKLYFSCYYVEDGCTFYGSFNRTYEHEKVCRFKTGYCPFVYQNKCDKQLQLFEIGNHIDENHADYVLTAEDSYITVENPSGSQPQCIYAFKINGNYFLIRSLFDKEEQKILYTFYRLTDDYSAKIIKFHSIAFNSFLEGGRVMNQFKLSYEFDRENAFSANIRLLENLEAVEKLKIYFWSENKSGLNTQGAVMNKIWWQCKKCFKVSNSAVFCGGCRKIMTECAACKGKCCTQTKHTWNLTNDQQISFAFICESIGCNQPIRGDKYLIHQTYLCQFKRHQCLFCDENYSVKEMVAHMQGNHGDVINPTACFINLDQPVKYVFINDADAFVAECNLSSATKKLAVTVIKVTEPNWEDDYIWKINIRKVGSKSEAVTQSSDCTMDGSYKEMDVAGFISNTGLKFTLYIARI